MNRQQGEGPTISSVGTILEITPGWVMLLLYLINSFLRVAVLDKPVDSQTNIGSQHGAWHILRLHHKVTSAPLISYVVLSK